ncbi:Ig-like domain-containing protein, partial [Pseudomonas sp. PDM22]|uniref:Ig-like domain-containing protein n=1 Tax=Pseudomonas sp. PDM22 TaxID=2769287 RepID=UPI00177FE2BE
GSSIDATLVAHDAAGNSADVKASHAYTVDLTAPVATLTIDTVAGDDIVNLEESKAQQTISGKVVGEFQAGDVVSFKLNGTDYSAKVAADGSWSVKVAGADLAAETNIHATLVAHDVAGNVGLIVADHGYTVDITAPSNPTIDQVYDDYGSIQGPIPQGGVTDDKTPALSGGADAGSTVVIYDNGVKIGTATATGDGKWTFTPSTDLSEGEHKFTVDATDAAGNTSAKSDVFDIITDYHTDKPVITSVFDDVGSKTGNLSPGDITDDTKPTISGTAEANSVVTIYDKGLAIGSATTGPDGKWTFEPTTELAIGAHSLTVQATDLVGNVSVPSDSFAFTVQLGSIGFEDFEEYSTYQNGVTLKSGVTVSWTGNTSVAGAAVEYGGSVAQGVTGKEFILWQGTVRMTLPDGGSPFVSIASGGVDGAGTSHIKYYDSQGSLLGTVAIAGGLGWKTNKFTAPDGKIVAYLEIDTVDLAGIALDHLVWGAEGVASHAMLLSSTNPVSSEALDTSLADPAAQQSTVTPEGQDSSVYTAQAMQALGLSMPNAMHVISGMTDTYYGANDGSVVTLKYVADQYLASDANKGIHGGDGVDVLKLTGHDQVLDLTLATSQGKLTGMEVIDLGGAGHNTLTLSLKDVLENGQADLFHSTDKHSVQMLVQGDASDTVNLAQLQGKDGATGGSWTDKGAVMVGGTSYEVYQHSSLDAELLVQQAVKVNLV